MIDRVIQKYLSTYAEPEVAQLADFPDSLRYQHCIVIPAFNEQSDFFTRFQLGPLHNQHALCILVINQPTDVSATGANQQLRDQLEGAGQTLWQSGNMHLLHYRRSNNNWLIIDRYSHNKDEDRRIPTKQGVGLARKIGCDVATALIARDQIASTWIHSTDADTFLPKNYFNLPATRGYSAAVYDFRHQNNGSRLGTATATYEQALRYYVRGLEWAGSPYAFHTIGSILTVNAPSYCQVRGFPKRSGGEDFYLLNKLAKVGAVHRTQEISLRIQARLSDRVPFGTGPAVAEIMGELARGQEYTYYNPRTFEDLRTWLQQVPLIWSQLAEQQDPLATLPDPIVGALQSAGWPAMKEHLLKQVGTSTQASTAIHHWFDAFKTLKFVHYLQAHHYPPLPLSECLAQAEFADKITER